MSFIEPLRCIFRSSATLVATRRALLKERRSLVIRFVRALDASMRKIHDSDVSARLLARNLRLYDKTIVEENTFSTQKKIWSDFQLPPDGVRYAIRWLQ